MGIPTTFSVSMVSDLFFRHIKELSIRSLNEIREGSKRPELRLVRGFGDFSELRSTSRVLKLVRA
ncbi:hypothetical protein HYU20_02410 [Candidatus Woesearchaeota archaeon]|nr:hypothetical protein [Candidatus Woesearchaeota archaeon]